MSDIGKVYDFGKIAVGSGWGYKNSKNLNRLYYIHGGSGTYVHGGKEYKFKPDMLYFLPYTAKIMPKSNPENPMLHSYADFELIPPITAEAPIMFDPETDGMVHAACGVFLKGAELASLGELNYFDMSNDLTGLCFSAVKFLALHISAAAGFSPVNDEVVIDALEYMLENLSKPITVHEVAKRYYITDDAIIRRFSKSMCTTPYAWLKNIRLKTARSLLDNGKSLSVAAAEVGYSDSSALLHAFRTPPAAAGKSHRETKPPRSGK